MQTYQQAPKSADPQCAACRGAGYVKLPIDGRKSICDCTVKGKGSYPLITDAPGTQSVVVNGSRHAAEAYKWDIRFLQLARQVSSWSRDPSTKCGSVIVRTDKSVASLGFNGFPKGCADDEAMYADRELKLERVVHAELNALLLAKEPVAGYTLYTWPPGFGPSCARCTAHIIQAGICRVVHVRDESHFGSRWRESAQRGLDMYSEAGVVVDYINPEAVELAL